MHTFQKAILAIKLSAGAITVAWAQLPGPIERSSPGDGSLSCAQISEQRREMTQAIAQAKAAQSSGQTTAVAGQAANVATEVASRTGLFGQIGGLAGHLFGAVAGKTAANVATEQGQQDAAAALERERQAQARSEHLGQLAASKGCEGATAIPSGAGAAPVAAAPAPAPAPQARPAAEVLAQVDASAVPLPSAPLDLKNDLVAEMKTMQRVVVPQFRVAFVAKTGVSARAGAGLSNLGQSTGFGRTITQAQSARVDMALGNVDYALMQGLSERLYADFVKRLTAAGKTVVPVQEMASSSGYPKIVPVKLDKPYSKSPMDDAREFLFATPQALPLAFMHIDTPLGNAGAFDQNTTKAFAELGATLNALVLIPTVVVDFAQLESSGRSSFATTAQADALPKVGISAGTMLIGMIGKDAKIFFHGDARFARLNAPFYTEGEFGSVQSVQSFDNVALTNSLTSLTGTQGTQHRYEKRLLAADPVQYASKVMQVGATVNDAFVRVLFP